ncbi:DNA polymerase beta domain-containing protein [Catenovulum agarivorans DS-2]|uniref:DNA polymerase beta domain-containing protein n=1 Tax=Catenovulum agarivorans DS-2 TaxID=1328313 RepID=W7Q879_9ALTE|nr:nucleotidyltransferase domain-containing protein [Catenovulum agarivorans]EWH08181.1 DNA polymerase beta domain-containing protein [Catenovulum agarivorans DS-2]
MERLIKEILKQQPGLELAILYGSAATGKMRLDSDIDIAVQFSQPLNAHQKMVLASQLEKQLNRTIDLTDLSNLNGTILKQVLTKGVVIVENVKGTKEKLIRRMIYNQADMMPYVIRTLKERQKRFLHG